MFGSFFKCKASISIGLQNQEVAISRVELLVENFTNIGDKNYDYLRSNLPLFLQSALRKIPFITLTESQKNQLADNITMNNYLNGLQGSSFVDKPIVYVKSKLVTSVHGRKCGALPFSICFKGNYRVENGTVFIELLQSSRYISFNRKIFYIEANIDSLMQNPGIYFLPYLKFILNYAIFNVSISVYPMDSIISIDGRIVGVGNVKNILLTAGPHRLHVHKDGFRNYDEVISIFKDGYEKKITLENLGTEKYVSVITNPSGAVVYLNEKYRGITPVEVKISSIRDVITLTKDGYTDKVIYPSEYINSSKLNIKLKSNWKIEQKNKLINGYKRRSKLLYYSGIGFLATTIIMGSEITLYKQKAQLYRSSNQSKYEEAVRKKNLYSFLTTISSFSSVLIFTFSFTEVLNYFKRYEAGE